MSTEHSSHSPAPEFGAISAEALRRLDDTDGLQQDRGKVLLTACMGFFTDAYDLFIIGLVLVMLKKEWGVTGGIEKLLASSVALLTAAVGAWAFGRRARGCALHAAAPRAFRQAARGDKRAAVSDGKTPAPGSPGWGGPERGVTPALHRGLPTEGGGTCQIS